MLTVPFELAVVIPAWNERENLEVLLPRLKGVLEGLGVRYEIVVADAGSNDGTDQLPARVVVQVERGYGGALLAGFAATNAERVVTMDADLSHTPEFVAEFWKQRDSADVLIASRYVDGGKADMPAGRLVLSRILNAVFGVALGMRVRDLSSGFRMYRREALSGLQLNSRDFDVLEEILCLQQRAGFRIRELAYHYKPREAGASHARILKFGVAYLRTLGRLVLSPRRT